MKFLKGLLIFVVIVALILVVVTFILPSEVTMERSRVIKAPKEVVFAQVNDLKNWEKWSPWHKLDPDMEVTYSDDPSGEGAWYAWKGDEKVGEGRLTISESKPHDMISTEMDFMEQGTANSKWIFEETEEGVKATWTFQADMEGLGKWMGLMMESMIGPSYEQGLASLDSIAQLTPVLDVTPISIPDTWYIGYEITTDMAGVANPMTYERGFKAVYGFAEASQTQPIGSPMAIYHEWSETGEIRMELAMPVADSIAVADSLHLGRIPGGPGLQTTHKGAYEEIDSVWEAFETYNKKNDVQVRWSPYEVYEVGPMSTADTAQWVTQVVYPVSGN